MNVRYELITDSDRWRQLWSTMPSPHILQSWEWGEIKRATTGWKPLRYAFFDGQTLLAIAAFGIRRLGPIRLMYAPRGPLFAAGNREYAAVLAALPGIAREQDVLWLKIDPGIALASRTVSETEWQQHSEGYALRDSLRVAGWHHSPQQIQFPNTQILDLAPTEETLLANISANTRRKIRVASRKGVTIRVGEENDLSTLFTMYAETAARDGFRIRPSSYYLHVWRHMMRAGMACVLIAEYAAAAIAHIILLHGGESCWFFYGASSNRERARMPNYALQWEGIRWAKRAGYRVYDFWGAPTEFNPSDPLWGVYQFKRGFRGQLVRGIGAWDYVPKSTRYALYQWLQQIRR